MTGTDGPDALVDELLTASRAFVGLAVRSIAAAPVEVTVAQHRVLVLLAVHGPQSVGEVADHLGVNPSNASRHCDRLQRLRLLRRGRSPDDGRVVRVELTLDGRRLVDTVTAQRRQDLTGIVQRLDPDDAIAVAAAVRAFNRAAQETADEHWTDAVGSALA